MRDCCSGPRAIGSQTAVLVLTPPDWAISADPSCAGHAAWALRRYRGEAAHAALVAALAAKPKRRPARDRMGKETTDYTDFID